MRTLSTNQSVNLNQPRIDQSIINGNKKEDKTKKNNSYGTIATVASYLTGATTGFLLAARVFSTLLLTSPALGTAGCLAIAALIGIASATILTKGLLFLLNACRNYCNSCLPIKKSESYIDPGQNLSAKQKEEQYKEALKNVSNLLCADRAFKESLLEAIDPENIGNISEKNLKEILAKGFVSTFLGTEPDEILENSKKLVDVAKKIIKEADEETKTKLIKSANDVLKNAQVPYQLVPQASDKQECRIIDLSADTISPEDAEILVKFYESRSLEGWYEFLDKAKATPAVRGEILKAYLATYSDDPNRVANEIKSLLDCNYTFRKSVAAKLETCVEPSGNQPQILELDLKEFFAEAYVHFFLGTKVNETSENSKELVDVAKKIIKEADEETKNNLIYRANSALLGAKKSYRLVPQASDKQKCRIIDLGTDTISPENAEGLVKFYKGLRLKEWYEFLNKAKATPAVREEIFKTYLATYSDDPNRVANDIERLLGYNCTFRKSVAAKIKAYTALPGDKKEISELDLKEFFAGAYVHAFLDSEIDETLEKSKELLDLAKKSFEKAAEEKKKNFIDCANDWLKIANSSYRVIPQASDKQECRIIDLSAKTISPEDAKGLVEFYGSQSPNDWHKFLRAATTAVREKILNAYLEMHSHEMLNEIEKFLGSDESFKNLFVYTTDARMNEARMKSLKNEEEISELNPVSIFAEVYVSTFLGISPDEASENSKELVDVVKKSFEEADEEGKKGLIKSANDVLKNAQLSYQLVLNSENQTIQIKTES